MIKRNKNIGKHSFKDVLRIFSVFLPYFCLIRI